MFPLRPLRLSQHNSTLIVWPLEMNFLSRIQWMLGERKICTVQVRLLTSHCSKHNLWKLTNHMEDHSHTENIETLKFNDDSQQFLEVFCCLIIPIFLKCWNEYYCKLLIFFDRNVWSANNIPVVLEFWSTLYWCQCQKCCHHCCRWCWSQSLEGLVEMLWLVLCWEHLHTQWWYENVTTCKNIYHYYCGQWNSPTINWNIWKCTFVAPCKIHCNSFLSIQSIVHDGPYKA